MTGLPGSDSDVRRAVDKFSLARQLEQDSLDMTERSEQDISDRTSGTGQLGQDTRDKSDWKSLPYSYLDRTETTGQATHDIVWKMYIFMKIQIFCKNIY